MGSKWQICLGKPDQAPGHAMNFAADNLWDADPANPWLGVTVVGVVRYCCPAHWPGVVPDQQGSYVPPPERLTD